MHKVVINLTIPSHGACFNPYNAILSLYTLNLPLTKPSWLISFSSSPLRSVDFIYSWYNNQSFYSVNAITVQIVCLQDPVQKSHDNQLLPSCCVYPFCSQSCLVLQ